MPRVIVDPAADRDIDEIFLYIGKDNEEAARQFKQAVRHDFLTLANWPGMGSPKDLRRRELRDVRFWLVSGFRNYLIFYRPISDGIEVLRVLHGARNIRAQFQS